MLFMAAPRLRSIDLDLAQVDRVAHGIVFLLRSDGTRVRLSLSQSTNS